jgi:hypothetical protein
MIQFQTLIRAKITDVAAPSARVLIPFSFMNAAAAWVSLKEQGHSCYCSSVFFW